MKILFFTDLHEDMKAMSVLKLKSKKADIVACAGDISTMEKNLPAIIKELDSFGKPTLIIPGNHENPASLKKVCKTYSNMIYLHKAVHHVIDYVFLGYGGDGFSERDTEFEEISEKFFKREAENKKRIIFITHGPAFATEIDKLGKSNRGNMSYREFIDKIRPHVVVSGHLHENFGKHHKIGRTFFLNPGKDGAIVEL